MLRTSVFLLRIAFGSKHLSLFGLVVWAFSVLLSWLHRLSYSLLQVGLPLTIKFCHTMFVLLFFALRLMLHFWGNGLKDTVNHLHQLPPLFLQEREVPSSEINYGIIASKNFPPVYMPFIWKNYTKLLFLLCCNYHLYF